MEINDNGCYFGCSFCDEIHNFFKWLDEVTGGDFDFSISSCPTTVHLCVRAVPAYLEKLGIDKKLKKYGMDPTKKIITHGPEYLQRIEYDLLLDDKNKYAACVYTVVTRLAQQERK